MSENNDTKVEEKTRKKKVLDWILGLLLFGICFLVLIFLVANSAKG